MTNGRSINVCFPRASYTRAMYFGARRDLRPYHIFPRVTVDLPSVPSARSAPACVLARARFLIARRAVGRIGVKISDVYYARISREKEGEGGEGERRKIERERERERRCVSQQRRGAKRQSGFMIFSQRHLSRDTPRGLKTTRARAKAARAL